MRRRSTAPTPEAWLEVAEEKGQGGGAPWHASRAHSGAGASVEAMCGSASCLPLVVVHSYFASKTMKAVTEQAPGALQVDSSALPKRLESRRQALQVSGDISCPGLQHEPRQRPLSGPGLFRPARRGAGVARCPAEA